VFFLQGNATEYRKCISRENGDILYLQDGCFDASMRDSEKISLLIDHDAKICLGTTSDRLEVHNGARALSFRFAIPDSWADDLYDAADDFETYLPVSIGFNDGDAKLIDCDGVKVKSVYAAKIYEISVLNAAPAIHSTYCRIVSAKNCGTLAEDCESGRLDLIGKYISLHRKFKASENGGIVKYGHTTSDYDRKADNFLRILGKLE
jgi:HK97 family phage prohead protease